MTSASYPAALDALANPGPTTETDDTGYELDIVVARLQNCVMAIETKLGIGTGGPPASAAVLRRTATGASAWQRTVTRQLNYTAAVDLNVGTVMTAGVYYDLVGNQSFTVSDASSIVEISVRGTSHVISPIASKIATQLVIDSAATPVIVFLAGDQSADAGAMQNALIGVGTVALTGLSAGSHTVKVQAICSASATLWCRPSTFPSYEGLGIVVMEYTP